MSLKDLDNFFVFAVVITLIVLSFRKLGQVGAAALNWQAGVSFFS